MKRLHGGYMRLTMAIANRWKVFMPMLLVVTLLYATRYLAEGASYNIATLYLVTLNPIPWIGAIGLIIYYFKKYDQHKTSPDQSAHWPRWKVWSFMAGILMMLLLWESPLNAFVPKSMTLYTLKLMGQFELAAPLIVFGIPFKLIDQKRTDGVLWKLLRFMHRPFVSTVVLAIILVIWDMSDQMAWGLKSPLVFVLLPSVYLFSGVIVWMQSLQAFPLWPNFRNHLRKAVYVWAMEVAMMAMGGIWFWSAMSMNPTQSAHRLWGLTPLVDQHLAGMLMMALALPTMCLVSWHFWQWIEDILREPGGHVALVDDQNTVLLEKSAR